MLGDLNRNVWEYGNDLDTKVSGDSGTKLAHHGNNLIPDSKCSSAEIFRRCLSATRDHMQHKGMWCDKQPHCSRGFISIAGFALPISPSSKRTPR